MSWFHTVSVGHEPTGQPAESLATKIKAQHHTKAADAQERLMVSYPSPMFYASLPATSTEHAVVQVPPFANQFYVTLSTDAATGTLLIRYYSGGGNVDHTLEWTKFNGYPEIQFLSSPMFAINPVTTSAASSARVHFYASVAMNCHNLTFHFQT